MIATSPELIVELDFVSPPCKLKEASSGACVPREHVAVISVDIRWDSECRTELRKLPFSASFPAGFIEHRVVGESARGER